MPDTLLKIGLMLTLVITLPMLVGFLYLSHKSVQRRKYWAGRMRGKVEKMDADKASRLNMGGGRVGH